MRPYVTNWKTLMKYKLESLCENSIKTQILIECIECSKTVRTIIIAVHFVYSIRRLIESYQLVVPLDQK